MTFARRLITATITLGEGSFGETAGSTLQLDQFRIQVHARVAGGSDAGVATITIFGLPLTTINQLTTVGPIAAQYRAKNTISIAAGNEGASQNLVYSGSILTAFGTFETAPDVGLTITATTTTTAAVTPVPPSSYKGAADVAGICQTLAGTMGFTFENNGVAQTLSNQYLRGSALDQLKAVVRAAGIGYVIDRGVLAIWPKNGARGSQYIQVSPQTGMIGYPTFSSNGLIVRHEYLPDARTGGRIQVQSSVPVASGKWITQIVQHDLESLTPGGAWFTTMSCYPDGH